MLLIYSIIFFHVTVTNHVVCHGLNYFCHYISLLNIQFILKLLHDLKLSLILFVYYNFMHGVQKMVLIIAYFTYITFYKTPFSYI